MHMTKEFYHALRIHQSVPLPCRNMRAGFQALNFTLTQTIANAGELRIKIEGCGNAQAAQAASIAASMAAGPAAEPGQLQQLQQLLAVQPAIGANPVNLMQLLSGQPAITANPAVLMQLLSSQPAIAGNPATLMQLLSGQPTMAPGNSGNLLQQLLASLPAAPQASAPANIPRLAPGSNPVRIRELPNTPRGSAHQHGSQGEDANGLCGHAVPLLPPHLHTCMCWSSLEAPVTLTAWQPCPAQRTDSC